MGELAKADTVGNHTLSKRGSRGQEVSDLQERLRQAGYEPGEDGVYDAKTVNTASAQGIADQLAKQGRWKGRNNPQPGDAVTFNWSGSGGRANHVGIVESVFQKNGQTYVRTIEGNSSDSVRYRTYPANSRVINGFGTIA